MKVSCEECGWEGNEETVLIAANPFDGHDTIQGCPRCHSVDTIYQLCDIGKCRMRATCGIPTKHGYKRVCGMHYSELKDSK